MRSYGALPGCFPFVAALAGGLIAVSAVAWGVEKRTSPLPVVGIGVGSLAVLALAAYSLFHLMLRAAQWAVNAGLRVLLLPVVVLGRVLLVVVVAIASVAGRLAARWRPRRGGGPLPPSRPEPLPL